MSNIEGRFTTDRLVLRPFQQSDVQRYIDLMNDIRVQPTSWANYIVPLGPQWTEKIKPLIDDALFIAAIETKDTSDWVGITDLQTRNPKNRDVSFGILLKPEHWNRGYGTEVTKWMVDYAFNWLAMHRVSLEVFELNDKAIDLYKRVGFVEEGRRRKSNWVDGRWTDIIYMGILEDEWQARRFQT